MLPIYGYQVVYHLGTDKIQILASVRLLHHVQIIGLVRLYI